MKRDPNSKRSLYRRHKRLIRHGQKSHCLVYGLRNEDGRYVYIGQTRCRLATRLSFHLRSAKKPKTLIELWLAANPPPQIVLLEKDGVWDVDEVLWIARMRERGEPLMNMTRGGRDNRRAA